MNPTVGLYILLFLGPTIALVFSVLALLSFRKILRAIDGLMERVYGLTVQVAYMAGRMRIKQADIPQADRPAMEQDAGPTDVSGFDEWLNLDELERIAAEAEESKSR